MATPHPGDPQTNTDASDPGSVDRALVGRPAAIQVGFVGAGQMGEPMVHRLLDAGHKVAVFVRKQEVGERLRGRGASIPSSYAGLAAESDVVVSCLYSDIQSIDVLLGPDGVIAQMKPGSVLLTHTTGSVEVLRRIDGVCRAHGVELLDAPVSGTADEISRGELTVLLGGAKAAVDAVSTVLGAYSNTIIETGGLGSALNVKLVNNLLFAANIQLVADAVRLGTALGVEADLLLDAVAHCSGSSSALEHTRQLGGPDEFASFAGHFLRKDIKVCTDAAAASGTDVGLLGRVATTGPLDLAPLNTPLPATSTV